MSQDQDNYGLPFVHHFVDRNAGIAEPPSVIIWTTTSAEEGDTVDHVAVVDLPGTSAYSPTPHKAAKRAVNIAGFICKALNAYTETEQGRREWIETHKVLIDTDY